MENVKIVVEGIADSVFIKQFADHIGFNISDDNIVKTDGWSKIESNGGEAYRIQIMQNTDEGGVNLVIFDADTNFSQREQAILKWKTKYGLNFELFLFPNNLDTGALEDLLEKIINPVNEPIFECWEGYESCLKLKTIVGRKIELTTPAKKTKIYGYLEALYSPSRSDKDKIKEPNRNYLNTSHWNLNIEYLNPLKLFLKANI